jgi:DNA-binding CsgD family transcriptional regulator
MLDHPLSRLMWESGFGATRDDYLDAALDMLAALFPSDSVGWNSLDTRTGATELRGTPPEVFGATAKTATLLGEVRDHPMVLSYLSATGVGGSEPRRLSDIGSQTELKRTQAYAELLHPFQAEFQFTILTDRYGFHAGSCWTFNRQHRDFSDDDLALASRLQPLLSLIERNWPLRDRLAPETGTLTIREHEVLTLLAEGMTASAVAMQLGISRLTVNKHLEHVYRKLRCGDRLIAVERGRQLGLLPDPRLISTVRPAH